MTALIRLLLGCGWCLILGNAHALSGPQTAAQLNARYVNTPVLCVGRTPAFTCSGILLRALAPNQPQVFWEPAVDEGSTLRFTFVRQDQPRATLGSASGFLLFDRLTAVAQGKPYQAMLQAANPSEVVVSGWAPQAPAQLAIQGVFYDTRVTEGLLQAQRSQRDYYQATGLWLPVLRLQLDEPQGKVFGFAQQDQLFEGYRVARRLNARYQDTAMHCRDGRAPFDCTGVFVRTVTVGGFDFWDPSPQSNAIQYVSFSYWRRDAGVSLAVSPQGYVTRELAAPAVTPFVLGCSYPVDAGTHGAQSGNNNACTFSGVCSQMGIDSVAAWSSRYKGVLWKSCSLGTDAAALTLMNDIRQQVPGVVGWNELMMKVWPQKMGRALPIEAVFYSPTTFWGGEGRTGSRTFQRQYFTRTDRQLPLLKLNAQAPDGQVFSYAPEDQGL